MIFFGHLGLTTGVMRLGEKLINKNVKNNISIDYRYVLLGSILPDIIDKPIGAVFFRNIFHNSRIFLHTLLFPIIFITIGLIFVKKNKAYLTIAISCFIHLILDSMWLYPGILLWPFFGLRFPVRPKGNWIKSDIIALLINPAYYIPEIIGFSILLFYFIRIIKRDKLKSFIYTGKID
ncbi:MAG TPA: metal-dependent hydrolase [Clostridiaceae bacterium]